MIIMLIMMMMMIMVMIMTVLLSNGSIVAQSGVVFSACLQMQVVKKLEYFVDILDIQGGGLRLRERELWSARRGEVLQGQRLRARGSVSRHLAPCH